MSDELSVCDLQESRMRGMISRRYWFNAFFGVHYKKGDGPQTGVMSNRMEGVTC